VSKQLAVVPTTSDGPLISVVDVVKHFPTGSGFSREVVRAVDGVTFDIAKGETLGLVGESGCGKSTLGRVIMQLHPATSGSIKFEGRELTTMKGNELRQVRQRMQIIFQDPYASLNPRMAIGDIVAEPLKNFSIGNKRAREKRVKEIMGVCGLNPDFANRYPHEFSGGQRQRIGIARALVLTPSLIVAALVMATGAATVDQVKPAARSATIRRRLRSALAFFLGVVAVTVFAGIPIAVGAASKLGFTTQPSGAAKRWWRCIGRDGK